MCQHLVCVCVTMAKSGKAKEMRKTAASTQWMHVASCAMTCHNVPLHRYYLFYFMYKNKCVWHSKTTFSMSRYDLQFMDCALSWSRYARIIPDVRRQFIFDIASELAHSFWGSRGEGGGLMRGERRKRGDSIISKRFSYDTAPIRFDVFSSITFLFTSTWRIHAGGGAQFECCRRRTQRNPINSKKIVRTTIDVPATVW